MATRAERQESLQRDYQGLSHRDKRLVTKHLKLSGGLRKWMDINGHLIEQMKTKKGMKSRGENADPVTNSYYKKYLFRGKVCIFRSDAFPAEFMGGLHDVLCQELSVKTFRSSPVYYWQDEDKPVNMQYHRFDRERWNLDDGMNMSRKDRGRMARYRSGLLPFLDRCIGVIKRGKRDVTKCLAERKRIERVMDELVRQ